MVDERAICAANNNADWYEAMFSIHGLKYKREPYAFVAKDVPPPYYSQLTVQSPGNETAVLSELAALVDRFDGTIGLNDSFSELDLEKNGFRILFIASWIWRSPRLVSMPVGWDCVTDASDLLLWEDAWKRGGSPTSRQMFPETFLARDDVIFLGQKTEGRFTAGCIANKSAASRGLSNVFAEEPSELAFSEAADAVAAICEPLPIVGYESGDDLDYADKAGFSTVGDLRILLASEAKF